MAIKKTKTNTNTTTPKKLNLKLSSQQKLIFGSFLIILGILLFVAFVSYFFTGKADQSTITELTSREVKADNWLNKLGAWVSDLFIMKGFGAASFVFAWLFFVSGIYVTLDINKAKLRDQWIWGTLIVIWVSIFLGFFAKQYDALGGTIGFEMNSFIQDYLGVIGTLLLLAFGLITFLAIKFNVTGETFVNLFKSAKSTVKDDYQSIKDDTETFVPLDNNLSAEAEDIKSAFDLSTSTENLEPTIKHHSKPELKSKDLDIVVSKPEENIEVVSQPSDTNESDIAIEVEQIKEEKAETNNLSERLVADFGEFDPTLELSKYQFPPLDLLRKYDSESITINQEELEENKNKIVETLNNYSIGIANIKATIGP